MGDGSAEKGGERCEGVICGHIYRYVLQIECTFVTFKNEDFMTRVCSTSTWVYYRVCHVPHTLSLLLLRVC